MEQWNRYRAETKEAIPELARADLSNADLSYANLTETNLSGANLYNARPWKADQISRMPDSPTSPIPPYQIHSLDQCLSNLLTGDGALNFTPNRRMPMPKSTAIYVRVSTKDQSHASQLPDLER